MKILFVGGCLEQGKDGVGDYTRRLASKCIEFGHEVALVAIFDGHTDTVIEENIFCPIIRFPRNFGQKELKSKLTYLIKTFGPDWISLQFVPFAFHQKGIITQQSFFKRIFSNYKIHVMIHELWVAEEHGAKMKMKIYGAIQKWSILKLLKLLEPQLIHTSIPIYQRILVNNKFKCSILPLFSNIPINAEASFNWLNEKFDPTKPTKLLKLGMFGMYYPGFNMDKFIDEASRIIGLSNVSILFIGKMGSYGDSEIIRLKEKYQDVTIIKFGIQPPERISSFIQYIDIGVCSTPKLLLGKSGSFLAMVEHRVPVVCVDRAEKFNFIMDIEINYDLLFESVEEALKSKSNPSPNNKPLETIVEVTQNFISELDSISRNQTNFDKIA